MRAIRLTVKHRLAVIVYLGALLAAASAVAQPTPPQAYICPMHPDVVSRVPGACPRCGMRLTSADPFDAREFLVEISTEPRAPAAGTTTRLRLTVREPASRAIVHDFVDVHEKLFHLFVISQDLEHYDHVHPVLQSDGTLAVDVTLPRPGYYRVYSDFLPLGGMPQVVPGVLVTAGYTGSLSSSLPTLVPDTRMTRDSGGMRVSLTLPADGLVAGREEKLTYRVADAATGRPVTDLEPYLAAFGHTLVLSEDSLHYVHAHPIELLPDGSGPVHGGPELTFKALLPRPGRYRIWTQLKRHGEVSTVAFTVDAGSPSATR